MLLTLRNPTSKRSLTDVETGEIIFTEDPAYGMTKAEIRIIPDRFTGLDLMTDLMESLSWDLLMDDLSDYRAA